MKRTLLPILAFLVVLLAAAGSASAATVTKTFMKGPIKVGGYSVDQGQVALDPGQTPNADASITRMDVDVVDKDGRPVPIQRLMLHHIVFLNAGRTPGERRDATCRQFTMLDSRTKVPSYAERFYAAGEERAQLALPPGYGYPIKQGDRWLMTYMMMNHRRQTDRAYIRYRVTYDDAPAMTPVRPYWFDVKNCLADPVYDVPGGGKPRSTDTRRTSFVMPESGRFVAGAGHVHGGAKNIAISRGCDNRTLIRSRPAWGLPSHPFYNVKPVLHEPGPINMSGTLSGQGLPVARGDRVNLASSYDAERPHTRVMGILVAYLAPDAGAEGCAAMPGDAQTFGTSAPHRKATPKVTVPLTGIDPDTGRARTISRPPDRTVRRRGRVTVNVRDFSFGPANLEVESGTRIRWRFNSSELHDVTVASGPRGFSSPHLNDGRTYSRRLTKPGTYRVFCSLHPVSMTATVTVRPKRRG